MRVLVTGGAGFIGSHSVDALLKRGYEVRILDNLAKPVHLKGKPPHIPSKAEFLTGDVRNKQDWEKALDGVDVIFHLAAYQDYLTDFNRFFHVNSVGTALLYEVIVEKQLPVKKVIIASSQAVYGEGKYECGDCRERNQCSKGPMDYRKNERVGDGIYYPDIRSLEQLSAGEWDIRCPVCGQNLSPLWTDEDRVNPQNQYAISKYSQELIGMNLGRRYGIPTVCLRYSIVQGPRQSFYNAYSGACRIFALSLFFDRAPTIYEDGRQLRDYVNIEDVVAANLLVMEDPRASYQVYNVGGGKAYTVLELYDVVAGVFGKDIPPRIPGEFRFGDTRHIISDISKLRSLGWEPRRSIRKSVQDYKQWLEEQTDIEDILEYQQERMRQLNVVRQTKLAPEL